MITVDDSAKVMLLDFLTKRVSTERSPITITELTTISSSELLCPCVSKDIRVNYVKPIKSKNIMKKIFASIKNFIKKMNFAARIAELDEKIWELAKENKSLSARIHDLEEAEVPYEDMEDFSERLDDIERSLGTHDIDDLEERIDDLENKVGENDLDDLDSRISELEEKLEDIDADSISDLSDKIEELDDKVSELEDKVECIPYDESEYNG